jgi:gas vesicle protein
MNDRMSIFCFVAGGVTGAALALILAPESGDVTRRRIRRTLRDTGDSARDLTDRVVQRGEEIRDDAARRVDEAGFALADRARQTFGNGDEVAPT